MKSLTLPVVHKYTVAIFLWGLLSTPLQMLLAQNKLDSVVSYFHQLQGTHQEKLYLHLDKPYYGAGDNIWYKGYLVNATSHLENPKSNFIITELINRTDSVILRKKIRRDSLGFQNAFTLPSTLPAGDYYIRGYTNWMQNEDPVFFYSRNLQIGNSIDVTILSTIEYQPDTKNNYLAKIRFADNNNKPYNNIQVRFQYFEDGKAEKRGKKKTNEYGQIYIPLNGIKEEGQRRIEVTFDDPQYVFEKTFHLPVFSKDFDVTFFPEGGALSTVLRQNIAFKVQGADGLSREINGYLMNSQGDTLEIIRSEHSGMGVFSMSPIAGESYHALITSSDSITKRFDLPAVKTDAITLAIVHHKQNILFEVQKSEQAAWPKELYLLAHTRGKPVIFQSINTEKPYGMIKNGLLAEGITHFLVVDGSGRAISERLIFITDRQTPDWQIKTNKEVYSKREKVSLLVKATDFTGAPLNGNFSISITNHKDIQTDSLADNILSNLLLTSDLKGHIENPGYYFLKQDAKTQRYLDLVMLTHGWRRHQIESVFRKPIIHIDNYIEAGQTISGRIKGLFGKNIQKGPIYVLAPQSKIIETTLTNEKGEFIVNTSFRDSTTFIIQARTKRGFAGVDILVDNPPLPKTYNLHPYPQTSNLSMDDYLINTREKYYMEGGMRVYNLKEVVVTANRNLSTQQSLYAGISDYTLKNERLSERGGQSILNVITQLPGISLNEGKIHIRNNPQQPVFVIDDLVYDEPDYSMLEMIQTDDVEELNLIRDAGASYFGSQGAGGAIVITLKDPGKIPPPPARGIITYTPLGYSQSVEFYHPTYDTPQKKENTTTDLRTTIYWNPGLQLNADGTATIEYYMPDSTAPQDIVIEGVSKNGKICRYTKTINQPSN